MESEVFYAQILAHALSKMDASVNITVEGKPVGMMVSELAEKDCCIALKKIQEILINRNLSDEECFQQIEEIICSLESLGLGCGERHDFG